MDGEAETRASLFFCLILGKANSLRKPYEGKIAVELTFRLRRMLHSIDEESGNVYEKEFEKYFNSSC